MERKDLMFISKKDILSLNIGMNKVIKLVEEGLAEHGYNRVENPPKPGIHADSNSFIHAMPAYFKDLKIGGLKWVSGYPSNRDYGLPTIMGLLILNDMETGSPICVMDATWITEIRTAAVSAITAKYCARQDSSTLGIIGAGVQGRAHLIGLNEVMQSLSKVKVFDIDNDTAVKFRNEMSREFDLEIVICKDVKTVAIESDILVTATQKLLEPLIKNEWFQKGSLGLGLEVSRAWYGDAILTADKFITDDWKQTKSFASHGAFKEGLPEKPIELGTIVTGKNKGRENSDERILAVNVGLALEDIILGNYIYELSKTNKTFNSIPFLK